MSARKTISNSFSVSTLEDGVVYDLRLTSGIVVQHDNGTRTPSTITISAYERRGEGDAELYTGDILLYNASGSMIAAYENYNTVNLTMNQAESVFPISVKLLTHAESELLAETAISLAKDGQTISALDLDNEYDSVNTDSTGKITAATTKSTIVRLYNGSTEVDISAATISVSGSPASSIATFSQSAEPNSGKGRVLSWSFIAAQTMTDYNIEISYTYNSVTYKATFTIVASKGQPIYQIQPTMTSVPFAYSNGSYTPASRNVGLAIVKLDGVGSRTMSTFTNAGTVDGGAVFVRYSKTAMPTSKTDGTAWTQGISSTVSVANTDTNLYIAIFNSADVLLDRETIPVIKDGVKGEQGKIGRFYYYAQKWEDSTTVSYEVTDTEAPYFYYNNNYWVFNPTTNGTYSMHDMGTPSDNTTGWELMYNDFKFIISQAIFSDFAKLGSAVFNKDFMISQWGEKNGLQSTAYQTFNPFFFRSNTYVAFDGTMGTMQITGNSYTSVNPLRISTLYLQQHQYEISIDATTTGGTLKIALYEEDGTLIGTETTVVSGTTTTFTYANSGNARYANICLTFTGSSYVQATITNITAKDLGWSNDAFVPNITLDFFRGYIYAQQGFFKNITVEGVLNNLVTVVDFTNNINTDLFIPINNSVSPYNIDEGRYSGYGNATYMFDALRSGNMVNIKSFPASNTQFVLPWYLSWNSEQTGYLDFVRTSTKYNGSEHLITETELRQLVGKEITFYSDSNSAANQNKLILPEIIAQEINYNANLAANDTMFVEPDTASDGTVQVRGHSISTASSVTVIFKCGLRKFQGNQYEVFYWAAKPSIAANTGWN